MAELTGQERPQGDQVGELGDQPASASVEAKLSFAREVFANAQDLTKTMDQKANNLLSSVALLTAALGILASTALTASTQDDCERLLKGAGDLLILVYLLM